jgi:hypothetical protein
MIATEPLSDETWEEIGIEHGQTFADRHLLVYGQRTADTRRLRGRGARYHWGSSIRSEYDRVCRRCSTTWRAPSRHLPRRP